MSDIVKAIAWLAVLGLIVIFGGRIFDQARAAASKSALKNLA